MPEKMDLNEIHPLTALGLRNRSLMHAPEVNDIRNRCVCICDIHDGGRKHPLTHMPHRISPATSIAFSFKYAVEPMFDIAWWRAGGVGRVMGECGQVEGSIPFSLLLLFGFCD